MAITLVNKLGTGSAGSGVTTCSMTVTNSTSSGTHILVAVEFGASNRTITVTDSQGNTYQQDGTNAFNSGGGTGIALFSSFTTHALTASTDTITATASGGTVNNPGIAAYNVSGLFTSSWTDQTASTTGSSGTPSSGSVTTGSANEFLFGAITQGTTGSTLTAGSGWTKQDQFSINSNKNLATETEIVSATGSYAANGTFSSNTWAAAIATYKGATGTAPVNTVAPALSGTAYVGDGLTTSNGTWTDDGSPTFTYQWQRDNNGGGIYSNISGQTTNAYTLASADDGCNVRCVVTDNTVDGNTSANSNSDAVTYPPPTNTVAPSASGTPYIGSVLTCTSGSWTP